MNASTRRIHARFRALLARAIVKADAEEAAHLAGLRETPVPKGTYRGRGRRKTGSATIVTPDAGAVTR
jgi:hypothetical protein